MYMQIFMYMCMRSMYVIFCHVMFFDDFCVYQYITYTDYVSHRLCCPAPSFASLSWVERNRTRRFFGSQKAKPCHMLMCQETSPFYLACKDWKNCQKTIDLSSVVTTASGNSDLFPDSASQRWPAVKEEKRAVQPAMSEGWCMCKEYSMSCQ